MQTRITPDWPAPRRVRALQSLRDAGPLESIRTSFDLPAEPSWLEQVHGVAVTSPRRGEPGGVADAAVTRDPGTVLAVKTADCLPILLCDRGGTVVAAAHAGWRGLAAGVVEETVAAMRVDGAELLAWLGPAIGQRAFEVGPEVRDAFIAGDPGAAVAFIPGDGDRLHADLVALARRRLAACGVDAVFGGAWCTHDDPARFFSYRRGAETGRMAALIWIDPEG